MIIYFPNLRSAVSPPVNSTASIPLAPSLTVVPLTFPKPETDPPVSAEFDVGAFPKNNSKTN